MDEQDLGRRLAALESAYANASDILNSVRDPLVILDEDLRVVSANRSFYETFRVSPAETEGRPLAELGNGQWNVPHLLEALRSLAVSDQGFERLEIQHDFERIGRHTMRLNARRVRRAEGKPTWLLLAMEDITLSQALQKALEESEAFQKALLEGVSDAILLTDETGRLTYAGGNTRGVLGLSPHEVQALGDIKRLLGEDFALPEVLVAQEEGFSLEREIVDAAGRRRSLLISVKRVPLVQGSLLYTCRDDTEAKARERALADALAELAAIYAHAPVAMMLVDRERRVRQVNEFAAHFAGRSAEEMIGLRSGEALRCLHHLDDPQGCGFGPACAECRVRLAVLETLADHQSRENVEAWLPFPREQGTEERCLLLSTAYLEIGEEERVLVCVLDITENKRAERVWRESEERFREIFDHVATGIAIYEVVGDAEDFIFKEINAAGARIGGLPREAHLGRSVLEVYPGVKAMGLLDVFQQVWRTGIPQHYPMTQYQDERLSLWVQNYVCKLPSGEIMAVYEDQTALKQAQEEREQLQRQYLQSQKMEAIGRLASGVAHDFNNLLTVILEYGQGALLDIPQDDPLRADIQEIVNAAQRASDLTRQLLAFSRQQPMQPRLLDLNEVVGNLERMLRRLIGEHIALQFVLSEEPLLVMADPSQLEQVIINLAVNARDAMPEGGKLLLETASVQLDSWYAQRHFGVTPGEYALLSVSDTGIGMDEETLSHIFEPFFTTKEPGRGTGLGLATVYGIVKQCGGHIHVYSEPGHGTTLKIYLPLPKANRKPEETSAEGLIQEAPHALGHEHILLVEDEETLGKMAEIVLTRQGYRVSRVLNAEEALALVEGGLEPDLVVTDVVLPGMNGAAMVERLRARFPGLKVLYMSGYTSNAIVHHGVLEPGTPFIQKPFTIQALANRVREILKG